MDLELSDEQRALQDAVRDFLSSECPVSLVRQVVEDEKGAEELWQKMVELDWPAMSVGESEGGLGLGFVELAVVAEELGRSLCPAPFMSTSCQFVPAVALAGSAEQAKRFLEPVARDGMVGTLALAEASGSFALGGIRTEAERAGGGWVLRGRKHFVMDGTRAEEIVVAARLSSAGEAEGAGAFALFVVPRDAVRCEPTESLDPTRQYSTVELEDTHVGDDRRLGSGETATAVLRALLDRATAALSAEIVGVCQSMFDIVHSYVAEREQFGVKIGSFQAIKHKLADMYVALESARAVCYFAALCIAEDDERRPLAVSMAKSSAGDCQKLVAQQAIQCLGGIGYTWEHDIHMFVKRAKASAALFGTAFEHKERVAAAIGLGDLGGGALT